MLVYGLIKLRNLTANTRKKKTKKAPEVQNEITFSGLDDAQIIQGKYFNCLDGVKATTSDGRDLTSKISVTGELNTAKEGDYALTYELFDDNNQKVEKQRNIVELAFYEKSKSWS